MAKGKGKRMGQPPKGEEALRADITTRLKRADRKRLNQEAKAQENKKPSTLARELILEGLNRAERKRKRGNA